ncbi:IPT/TIG domain-containing protein [Actinoplanes utahensis]|uniref:IPT/TIG domain-containing protein n=1 Tax=Actinoplanes utahensis TaxID=1869 RepID=A0A0A6UHE8_ACTUT|nr:IPT/TIG domain-containing protein [Actinoplanes utahensis]KHD74518.1 hypothetical protein MB27_28280 [Actinoplanes utahensis]GIF28765.1 hypothetical protein Aut01nite_17510 [Actinoplanes utahensis]
MAKSQHPFFRAAGTALISAAASALVVVAAAAPAQAAPLPMTLSSPGGPSGGGNLVVGVITPSSAVPIPIAAGTVPTVQFQFVGAATPVCNATARPVTQIVATGTTTTAGVVTVDPADVKRVSYNRVAFEVPSGSYPQGNGINTGGLVLAAAQTMAKWNVCVYDSDSTDSSTLLASAPYTLVARPKITSILPATSPAAGGQLVTVNGVGFGTGPVSVTIGGTPLTDVKLAANGNSLTGITAPRVPSANLQVEVTAAGGTVGSLDPDNDPLTDDSPILFAYTNGITISPGSSPAGRMVTVDIRGVGFNRLDFGPPGGDPTSDYAHVFLVSGAYASATNRGVAECRDAVVLSDTELVCTLDLSEDKLSPANSAVVDDTPIPEGAYILTVVEDGSTSAGVAAAPTVVSTGAVFVVAPY